ncbi:MAG: tRNA(Ile)-lysidine synthetase [Alphaproteobacteria bacterium]|nr:MAG: tRNA(Ile)-lysidine synthetase [Alphaproteobacteria bacterium]
MQLTATAAAHIAPRVLASGLLDGVGTLGLAVSGGGDSMALLHLMATLAPARGLSLRAATVDHGLRPEAADEARFVAEVCARLGVPHETLVWDGRAARGNLQAEARAARYRLLAGWAAGQG